MGVYTVYARRSDQKLQDVVDRIFPEHKERDNELEQQFYERHNFKKKKKTGDRMASNSTFTTGTEAAVLIAESAALDLSTPVTNTVTLSSSTAVEVESSSTSTGARAVAAVTTTTAVIASAQQAAVANGSSSAAKRKLKRAQQPLSNWGTTVLKLFTIQVYPENWYVSWQCSLALLSGGY